MKGNIGKDMMVKIVLALMVAAVIMAVVVPLIMSAGSSAQGCGAFRNWLTDLSSGAVELC